MSSTILETDKTHNRYIVLFKDSVSNADISKFYNELNSTIKVLTTYTLVKGFAAEFDHNDYTWLEQHPMIEIIGLNHIKSIG
ncbi:unnamed protein product [Rotaria sp. Silwood1]|nr:unnamed protein product [Rotaria sp. Silwood1]CAF3763932.1 unnamed protein product [Rotaria sp. Silwood1]